MQCTIRLLLFSFLLAAPSNAVSQETALLLFGGENNSEFAGCLNCSPRDPASVCFELGDFGSRYSDLSIWNRFGKFGSRYEDSSPWNRYGRGLAIVDEGGNFYGYFTTSRYDRSKIPVISALIEANNAMGDLVALRDLYCEK